MVDIVELVDAAVVDIVVVGDTVAGHTVAEADIVAEADTGLVFQEGMLVPQGRIVQESGSKVVEGTGKGWSQKDKPVVEHLKEQLLDIACEGT